MCYKNVQLSQKKVQISCITIYSTINYMSIILNRPVCDSDTLLLSPAERSQKKKKTLRNWRVFTTSTKKVPLDLRGSLQNVLMEVAQHNTIQMNEHEMKSINESGCRNNREWYNSRYNPERKEICGNTMPKKERTWQSKKNNNYTSTKIMLYWLLSREQWFSFPFCVVYTCHARF